MGTPGNPRVFVIHLPGKGAENIKCFFCVLSCVFFIATPVTSRIEFRFGPSVSSYPSEHIQDVILVNRLNIYIA